MACPSASLTQARDTFRSVISECEPGIKYRSRMMVTGAGPVTLLGKADTDIAFLSLPMLAKGLGSRQEEASCKLSQPADGDRGR